MNKINEWQGYSAEANLIKLLKDNGFKVELSLKDEDIHKHIDLFFYKTEQYDKDNKKWSIDVKALSNYDNNSIWLTMKTYFGNFGPLDAPELDFLVFERPDKFVFVLRSILSKFINDKFYEHKDMTIYYNNPAPYKYYSKGSTGGEQLSIWFPFDDIKHLVVKEYFKDKNFELAVITR